MPKYFAIVLESETFTLTYQEEVHENNKFQFDD